ncbi:MAG: hypothetical protein ABSD42_07690 [Candidatus Bathyarchaeia archaeon]
MTCEVDQRAIYTQALRELGFFHQNIEICKSLEFKRTMRTSRYDEALRANDIFFRYRVH